MQSGHRLLFALFALSALPFSFASCAQESETGSLSSSAAAMTVGQAASDTNCSTTIVAGLSAQLIEEILCDAPNALVAVPDRSNLAKGPAVFAYMETPARDALVTTLDAHTDMTMTVNSMLRTLAQQYLLQSWVGTCGITAAAKPGSSNHETGLAIDVEEHAAWQSALESHDFAWFGSGDVVHFDYTGGTGTTDLHPTGVKAFQKLWNRNNPDDLIDEDGVYGPQTEARLSQSPAGGFPLGAPCSTGTGGSSGASGTGGTSGTSGTAGTSGHAGSAGDGAAGANTVGGASGEGGAAGAEAGGDSGASSGSLGSTPIDVAIQDNNGNGCSLAGAASTSRTAVRTPLFFAWISAFGLIGWRRRKPSKPSNPNQPSDPNHPNHPNQHRQLPTLSLETLGLRSLSQFSKGRNPVYNAGMRRLLRIAPCLVLLSALFAPRNALAGPAGGSAGSAGTGGSAGSSGTAGGGAGLSGAAGFGAFGGSAGTAGTTSSSGTAGTAGTDGYAVADGGTPDAAVSDWCADGSDFQCMYSPLLVFDKTIPSPFQTHFDTGFVPSGSPLQLQFILDIPAYTRVRMGGRLISTWPEAITHNARPARKTGVIDFDYGIETHINMHIDVSVLGVGYDWTGELFPAQQINFHVKDTSGFDPWAFAPGIEANGFTPEIQLVQFSILSLIGVPSWLAGGGFKLSIQGELQVHYQTEKIVVSNTNAPQLSDDGTTKEPWQNGAWTEHYVHPEGKVDYTGVIHFIPALYIEVLGVSFDYDLADIPFDLSLAETPWIFDDQLVHVPLPDVRAPIPAVENFGQVEVGQQKLIQVELPNIGEATGYLQATVDNSLFEVLDPGPTVKAGKTAKIPVSFAPEQKGFVTGDLVVMTNDPDNPEIHITLNAEGIPWTDDDPPDDDPDAGTDGAAGKKDAGVTNGSLPGISGIVQDGGCGCRTTSTDSPASALTLGGFGIGMIALRLRRLRKPALSSLRRRSRSPRA